MKTCPRCWETKQFSEFTRDRNNPDGCNTYCKQCRKLYDATYSKTDKFKVAQKKYRQTEAGKQVSKKSNKKYRHTGHGKEKQREWGQTNYRKHRKQRIAKAMEYAHSERGKITRRVTSINYRRNHPERYKANSAVTRAIRSGYMKPAKELNCRNCPNQAISYHHHKGYEFIYWLDVIPLCNKCHKQ